MVSGSLMPTAPGTLSEAKTQSGFPSAARVPASHCAARTTEPSPGRPPSSQGAEGVRHTHLTSSIPHQTKPKM